MRLDLGKIEVGHPEVRPAAWAFRDKPVRGTEYRFGVVDRNARARNRWDFVVRVPEDPYGRLEVRPIKVPNDKSVANLDRQSLTFMRATRPGYAAYRYCQLSLAKLPGFDGTRDIVHRTEKAKLPYWLKRLGWRLKQKQTVRNTRGTDGEALVVLIRRDDYQTMIRTFIASKAWILKRGFALPDA